MSSASGSTDYVKPNRRRLFKALLAGAATVAATLAKGTVSAKAGGNYRSGKHNKVVGKHHGY
jgi:hypothetical protein